MVDPLYYVLEERPRRRKSTGVWVAVLFGLLVGAAIYELVKF